MSGAPDLTAIRAAAAAAERSGRDVVDALVRAGFVNTEATRARIRAEVLERLAGELDRSTVHQLMGQAQPATGEDLRKRLIELLEVWHDRELITAEVYGG